MISPARQAREAAGLSAEQAARRARVSESYLRRAERCGCSYILAQRLAPLYGCPIDLFLPKPRRAERHPKTRVAATTQPESTRTGSGKAIKGADGAPMPTK